MPLVSARDRECLQTGTEIDEVLLPGEGRAIRFREAGSPMISLWPSYFAECRAIVFLIDLSQFLGISAAAMELLDVLEHAGTADKPFLVVLNKTYVLPSCSDACLWRLPPGHPMSSLRFCRWTAGTFRIDCLAQTWTRCSA